MPTADYLRVAADLRNKIRSGELEPGSKLPTKRQLAAEYGVGRNSVDAAMIVLKAEGLIEGHQGRGVYVRHCLSE